MSSSAVPKLEWLERNAHEAFEDIRDCSILSYFPDEFLDILSTFGETRMVVKGEEVLREGQVNAEFFFLLSGSVEILVDNTPACRLSEMGEVFGEMSMIAEAPCTATVRALEDSCCLVFNHAEITDIVEQNREEFGYVLYQVFSKILTKRLSEANQTTQLVESKNVELNRMSREIELIAHERFQELWGKGNLTFDHLERIYKNGICELVEDMVSGEAKKTELETIQKRLEAIQEGLRPIFDMYTRERTIQTKRVLLAEPEKKYQRFIKTALVGAGVTLKVIESRDDAFKVLNQEPFDILLTSPQLIDVAEMAHSVNSQMKLVLMTVGESSQYAHYFRSHPYLANIVSLHENARIFTLKNIFTTVGKLASGDLFGMEKYLNFGADVRRISVSSSDQRADILDKMEKYFKTAGLRNVIIDRCRSVAEEMLMNAVYDAPTDSKGNARYNHVDRSESVDLQSYECAEFHFSCDGVMAALSIQDPFGALDRDTVLDYLDWCKNDDDETAEPVEPRNPKSAGAGMGIHLIVQSSDMTIFNVREGIKTEVIALFNIDRKAEERLSNSFIHLFYE